MTNSKKSILIIDVIFIMFGCLGFLQMMQKPDIPFMLAMQGEFLLIRDTTNNVAIPGFAPDKFRLIAVDGNIVTTKEDVEFTCDGLQIGNKIQAIIESSGSSYTISFTLIPFYSITYTIISAFLSLLILSVAVIVIVYRPVEDKSAWIFHGLMLMLFCIISMTWGSYIYPSIAFGLLTRLLFSTAYAFVPLFFVWFTFVFPKEKWQKAPLLILILSIIAVILSIGMGYSFIRAMQERSSELFNRYEIWFDVCRTFFAIAIAFSVLNFYHSYKYATEESERRKLRWIFLGSIIGPMSFVLLWQLPQLFTSSGLIPEEFILLFATAIPLTFGFSIVRYHTFDIDLLFRRSTVYGLSLLLVISLYAILVGSFTILIGQLTVLNSVVLSGTASVISALLFQPLKDNIKNFVDRKFFVVQYSFREVQVAVANKLESCYNVQEIENLIISEINKTIPLKHIAIVHQDAYIGENSVISADSYESSQFAIEFSTKQLEIFDNNPHVLRFIENSVEKGVSYLSVEKQVFGDTQFCGMIPIVTSLNSVKALLLLGFKKSEFVFSHEDIDLLLFTCTQAATAIERIELQANLTNEKTITAKLKELGELKSFFVSSVSHELKTPLTSIRMFAEILRNSAQPLTKQDEYLQIIEGESERLTRLINNVLDFSKIEKGLQQYTIMEIDLIPLIKNVMRMMHYQLKMNSFSVTEQYDCIECPVMADKDAIIEACMNLISNAIKYSDTVKSINVSLSTDNNCAVLTFRDKGIGIPSEKLEEIFEPYTRIKSNSSLHAGGTGLGLSIVKHIIDAHGGKIDVKSSFKEGSEFSLILPLIKT